jgi:hypothetical protein
MMRKLILPTFFLFLLAAACQPTAPACPPGSITYLSNSSPINSPGDQSADPNVKQLVEINGQELLMDQVVKGMLCDGSWSGNVYIPCQIQIYEWQENPDFLKNCELVIEDGTVVYVAAHHDQAYYQGCSCHREEMDE